jgi:hypothetical protein
MTARQKRNISRGVKLARQRKRMSDAMKASWARRKTTNAITEFDQNQPKDHVPITDPFTGRDFFEVDHFKRIEALALTWKGLEAQKWQTDSVPRLKTIIQGAIDRIRLEIILVCQDYLKQ